MLRKLLSLAAAALFAQVLLRLFSRVPAVRSRSGNGPAGPLNPVLSPEVAARIRAFSEPR